MWMRREVWGIRREATGLSPDAPTVPRDRAPVGKRASDPFRGPGRAPGWSQRSLTGRRVQPGRQLGQHDSLRETTVHARSRRPVSLRYTVWHGCSMCEGRPGLQTSRVVLEEAGLWPGRSDPVSLARPRRHAWCALAMSARTRAQGCPDPGCGRKD